jgi:hypothetical protein
MTRRIVPRSKEDPMKKQTAARRQAAYHAAGHAVMAHLVAVPLTSIAIRPGDGPADLSEWTTSSIPAELASDYALAYSHDRATVERRIMVLLAGGEAERRYLGRPGIDTQRGLDDVRQAVLVAASATASEEEAAAYFAWQFQRVLDHFDGPFVWSQVKAVAAALLSDEMLSAERVAGIVADADRSTCRLLPANRIIVRPQVLDAETIVARIGKQTGKW